MDLGFRQLSVLEQWEMSSSTSKLCRDIYLLCDWLKGLRFAHRAAYFEETKIIWKLCNLVTWGSHSPWDQSGTEDWVSWAQEPGTAGGVCSGLLWKPSVEEIYWKLLFPSLRSLVLLAGGSRSGHLDEGQNCRLSEAGGSCSESGYFSSEFIISCSAI